MRLSSCNCRQAQGVANLPVWLLKMGETSLGQTQSGGQKEDPSLSVPLQAGGKSLCRNWQLQVTGGEAYSILCACREGLP